MDSISASGGGLPNSSDYNIRDYGWLKFVIGCYKINTLVQTLGRAHLPLGR